MTANPVQRADALAAGSQLQSYIILKVIGSGAFGVTYLAEHIHLGSQHVIKEYFPDSGVRLNGVQVGAKSTSDQEIFDWGLGSFFQEAKLLYGLSHPNIVKVTDLFEANGTAYFVMPYLRGITLHQWIKDHPNPGEEALAQIFIPLLEGLKYIHERQLLHRDIKPENIFITYSQTPVLIDFGAARQAIGQKSRPLTQILTPPFAPIEQYQSRDVFLPALDLYSLGACIYQAITGRLIEEAPSRIVGEDTQPRLAGSRYRDRYSPHFLAAVDYALNVRAENRFQSAMDMQQALLGQQQLPPAVPPQATVAQPQQPVRTTAATSGPRMVVRDGGQKQAVPVAAASPKSSKVWLWTGLLTVLVLLLVGSVYVANSLTNKPEKPVVGVAQAASDPPVQLPDTTELPSAQPEQSAGGQQSDGQQGGRMEISPEAVAAMNEGLPQMMGPYARLDRISYVAEQRMLVYQLTFVQFEAGDLTVSERNELRDSMRSSTCDDINLNEWVLSDGKVLFAFADKNGVHMLELLVTSDECAP